MRFDQTVMLPFKAYETESRSAGVPVDEAGVAGREAGTGHSPQLRLSGTTFTGEEIDLKLLVIASEEEDLNLTAIRDMLCALGTHFDVIIAGREAIVPDRLWNGRHAYYQGVILTTGSLSRRQPQEERWESSLAEQEWQHLRRFQALFGIRQVTLAGCPGLDAEHCGLTLDQGLSTNVTPLPVTLTEAGREIFWYLNPASPVILSNCWVCLARPTDDGTIPLLLAPGGQVVAGLRRQEDGRECMTLTMTHGPDSTHTLLLGYGLINWVTQGRFLGTRLSNLSPQIDDIFGATQLWDPEVDGPGRQTYRLSGADVDALIGWLDRLEARGAGGSGSPVLDLAFNGGGVRAGGEDDLVSRFREHQARFRWVNHTFSHRLLNDVDYEAGLQEIERNLQMALQLGLQRYQADSMVTPELSGLTNREFLRAACDAGIRYLVSDTSRLNWGNPGCNTAIVSSLQPEILIIPRHPTNLFFDVSTPGEWIAEYNHFYRAYWHKELTYPEILDKESQVILHYLLKFDLDPLMFHQANLRSYDGTHSVFSDLMDAVLAKYKACVRAPLTSLSMRAIGESMAARAVFDGAQVDAQIEIASARLVLASPQNVTVPITGIWLETGLCDRGVKVQGLIPLTANEVRRIPLSEPGTEWQAPRPQESAR